MATMYKEKAKEFAKKYHDGQVRDDGRDYFEAHIQVVVDNLLREVKNDPNLETDETVDKILSVAYLHDVLEDTDATMNDLLAVFPKDVCEAVEILTKKKGEMYYDFVNRIIASKNLIAKTVKISDLAANMQDATPKEKKGSRYAKYQFAGEKITLSIIQDFKDLLKNL